MQEDPELQQVEEPFKIGTHVRGSGIVEFHYDHVFQRQATSGPERLVVAPHDRHTEVLLRLAREVPPPYWILYILLVPHADSVRPGRYQLTQDFDEDGIREFLRRFRQFFEKDAHHHLWIGSKRDESLLVYDQHNVIYAYGPVDQFASILEAQGLREADVNYPFPHTHHFRSSMDAYEEELLSAYSWEWFPLEEQDED